MAKNTTKSTKSTIKPLFDYVLIKPLQAEEKTAGGIILPDTAKEKPQMGEVMAVGKGHRTPDGKIVAVTVGVGDQVMYKKWGGNEVKVNGEDWMLVEEKDILAVME